MSKTKTNLQELLAHNETYAQWFALNESQSQALVKRNLKFLRGLNPTSKITLTEVDQLTEQDIKELISAAKTRQEQIGTALEKPKTSAEFFHSVMSKSPYFSEIISHSNGGYKKSAPSEQPTLSASTYTHVDAVSKKSGNEAIHGFHLHEGEAFSSTRYFSKDKKSFATIIAKDGEFKAHHQNLNSEQKKDVAFEMAFQFLLNLPPDCKTVSLSGPPEMIHKMRAAFLQLQKESGARFTDLNFQLPEGMFIAPGELNDEYIKHHLGTSKETPSQITQWRQFLALPTATHEHTHEASVMPAPTDKKKVLIDMARVFHAPGLSQEDKMLLNEYQHYLQETWVNGLVDDKKEPGPRIEEHKEFMQRTEAALRVLHKAPSLQKEYEAFKTLYINIGESHYKMLEQLHQNDLDYEQKMNELLPNLQKTQREAIAECLNFVTQHLEIQMLHAELNEEQQKELAHQAQAMEEVTRFIEGKDALSGEEVRSCGAQIHHAMRFLESVHDFSKTPIFQQMKQFSKEQSEKKDHVKSSSPEHLAHAAHQVKERLVQFKKEFQQSEAADITVSLQMKEQFKALSKKINRFSESMDETKDKELLEHLAGEMKKISESTSVTRAQLDALNQYVDKVSPLIKDQAGLTKDLSNVKELTKTELPPLLSPSGEKHSGQPDLDASRLTL